MNAHDVQDSAVYWYIIWISLAGSFSKSAGGLETPKPKFRENKQVL